MMLLALWQVPTPPPSPPILMPGEGAPLIAIFIVAIALTLVLVPIARAFARRLEQRGSADPALQGTVDELRGRVAELEEQQGRMAELEERLDFAERLLAQQSREPDRLAPGQKG